MSLLLQLLEEKFHLSPQADWVDADDVKFNKLAENAMALCDQYRIQCATLVAYINASEHQTRETTQAIQDTLAVAKLMEALFSRMNETDACFKFTEDKHFLEKQLHHINPTTFPAAVQYLTYESDTIRLYLGHIRRIGLGLLASPEAFGHHNPYWLVFLVQNTAPILAYASLLIYLPRTLVNIVVMLRKSSRDSTISLNTRQWVHYSVDDRLFLVINDLPSIIAACIGFFILTGPTLALAVYLTATVKFAEVLIAVGKASIDSSRLYTIRDEYNARMLHNKKNDIAITAFDEMHMQTLNAYIEHEKEKLNSNAIMHTLLLPCLMVFIPFVMAIHPWLPIVAAVCAIALVCIRVPSFRNIFIGEPPEASLQSLNDHRFFQPREPNINPEVNAETQAKIQGMGLTTEGAPVPI